MGFLDRRRIVAKPGFNRWLVPPAALSIHLCIGEVYAFSVFNFPLEQSGEGWSLKHIGWVFSIAIVFLGLSAAVFGAWLERVGPRKAMFASAACFAGGFLVAALGVWVQQLWLVCLGYGVLGGIGLGLGYISPVSTLIKWFPDRPGMATGLAIMGFGGGAMIGSPLSFLLLEHFKTVESTGVMETFATLGVVYGAFMMFGVLTVRLPPMGWKPEGFVPTSRVARPNDMTADEAIRTPQFWFLWVVLCMNVTAGIGVLGQASPMIQEMFPGVVSPAAGAGFVGLLSLFNMVGRICWSSLSDVIGRKATYTVFFALGAVLYAATPETGRLGNVTLFVLCYAIIMSMYGGGFATIPAYLRDQFGTVQVGAIHGRLLTAWALAGVAGPLLVNEIRESQIRSGVPKADAYTVTMYLMAGLLVVGFVCNLLVRPGKPLTASASPATSGDVAELTQQDVRANGFVLGFRWLWVGVPLTWGIWKTIEKSLPLFNS
ncbi:MAG: OFA family MFS transporter [Planctomycetes bacterium]|nr:OFA family MFS transporter [Planctomycetota bacterium]